MSQSYESKLPPELGPNMGDVIQRTMETANEILDDLDPRRADRRAGRAAAFH